MSSTALVRQPEASDLPTLSVVQVKGRLDNITALMRSAMDTGIDFGAIPGTGGKPTLLKPGAEKLCVMFQLAPAYRTDKTYHADGHLTVECVCTIHHAPTNGRLGEASAMCTTREAKYAYRGGARKCPECGKATIKKSKFPPRDRPNDPPGFYCFSKVGGCGMNFAHDDTSITSQSEERVPNPDIADSYNTVLRIAEKRALVAAVRLVTGASAIFDEEHPESGEPEDGTTTGGGTHSGAAGLQSPPRNAAPAPAPSVDRAKIAATVIATMRQATTQSELLTAYRTTPAGFLKVKDEHTASIVAAKDEVKAALSKPAPTLAQMKDEIDQLCGELGYDGAQLTMAEEECGIRDVVQITDVEAAKLVTYLRNKLKNHVPV